MFDDFETEKFPKESCTIQNAREKEVKDSPEGEVYLCVVVDKRFPNQCRLEHLRPYTAKNGRKLLFGWAQIDFDGFVDHITNSVHQDDQRVVAWKKVETPTRFMPPSGEWPDDK